MAEPVPMDFSGSPRVAGGELTLSAYPNPSRGIVTLRLGAPEASRFRASTTRSAEKSPCSTTVYSRRPQSAEALIKLAMVRLMLRRLARHG